MLGYDVEFEVSKEDALMREEKLSFKLVITYVFSLAVNSFFKIDNTS